MQPMRNMVYYAAVLFNAMFAMLLTVTLLGIIFITRPQKPMHDISPEWWIPIAITMIPAQAFCQYLTWKTVFNGEVPSPLAISAKQGMPQLWLRLPLSFIWAANFLIGFAIVVSLFEPVPGNQPGPILLVLLAFVAFSLNTITFVYWMLFVRTITSSEELIKLAWFLRHAIGVAISLTAVIYYRIAF